jgi:hypothetical protein
MLEMWVDGYKTELRLSQIVVVLNCRYVACCCNMLFQLCVVCYLCFS